MENKNESNSISLKNNLSKTGYYTKQNKNKKGGETKRKNNTKNKKKQSAGGRDRWRTVTDVQETVDQQDKEKKEEPPRTPFPGEGRVLSRQGSVRDYSSSEEYEKLKKYEEERKERIRIKAEELSRERAARVAAPRLSQEEEKRKKTLQKAEDERKAKDATKKRVKEKIAADREERLLEQAELALSRESQLSESPPSSVPSPNISLQPQSRIRFAEPLGKRGSLPLLKCVAGKGANVRAGVTLDTDSIGKIPFGKLVLLEGISIDNPNRLLVKSNDGLEGYVSEIDKEGERIFEHDIDQEEYKKRDEDLLARKRLQQTQRREEAATVQPTPESSPPVPSWAQPGASWEWSEFNLNEEGTRGFKKGQRSLPPVSKSPKDDSWWEYAFGRPEEAEIQGNNGSPEEAEIQGHNASNTILQETFRDAEGALSAAASAAASATAGLIDSAGSAALAHLNSQPSGVHSTVPEEWEETHPSNTSHSQSDSSSSGHIRQRDSPVARLVEDAERFTGENYDLPRGQLEGEAFEMGYMGGYFPPPRHLADRKRPFERKTKKVLNKSQKRRVKKEVGVK